MRASPVSDPRPGRQFKTPGGTPSISFHSYTILIVVNGAYSGGFMIPVQPEASIGAILNIDISMGKFQGVIPAHTPTGSFLVIAYWLV